MAHTDQGFMSTLNSVLHINLSNADNFLAVKVDPEFLTLATFKPVHVT